MGMAVSRYPAINDYYIRAYSVFYIRNPIHSLHMLPHALLLYLPISELLHDMPNENNNTLLIRHCSENMSNIMCTLFRLHE